MSIKRYMLFENAPTYRHPRVICSLYQNKFSLEILNFSYISEFKPDTKWASTQRHLPSATSDIDISNNKSYSSYRYSGNFTFRNSLDGNKLHEMSKSDNNSSATTLETFREGEYRPRVQTVHYKPTYLTSPDPNKLEEEQYSQIRRKTLTTNEILERKQIQNTIASDKNLTDSEQNLLDTLKRKSSESNFINDKIDRLKTNIMGDLDTDSTDSKLEDTVTTYPTRNNVDDDDVEEDAPVPLRNEPVPLPRTSSSEQLGSKQPGLVGVPLTGTLHTLPPYNGAPLNAAPPGMVFSF